ncbi:DUF1501 domain-containing protein [Tuwongella immobilis]|uniref:DUF1501 domain-containing protein n=1 Tax=Tuwongella immobilis TaxID=692036 RepID=A0A6C2YTX9_9BACT|nr:DUF1501 domain-containing protein [Tuwongella immobilis]VIP04884.1 protein containing duf1501 : Putative uncharacterized protein OS=uncultured Acidobacteria bacterium A2 PE=4 SV=1: DUF1501 [Tuwongella immobilis]VTS07127.1 protein containing duf1501 : Putative uncharacterized protein OS=uncultured Acidobacteria bacterium A2 PE=4 SV=1: DUF1501 [Tuwongella immobilis]
MSQKNARQFCGRTRREFVWETGCGFGGVALAGMMAGDRAHANTPAAAPAASPLAVKPPHFAPKAKSVIFLFMYGGPSHIETFDYKPKLYPLDGKTIPIKTFGRGGRKNEGRVVGPRWQFKQYGQSGKWISDLFPNLGTCVDDMAFIHSMYAESPIHGSAMFMMNSGRILSGFPSLGSWVTYGLGTVNQNLPGYVVMLDHTGGPISGPKNWSSGFMPAAYQGVVLKATDNPILNLQPPAGADSRVQRMLLDRLREKNEAHLAPRNDNSELSARIASYELAFKMQQSAPEAVDFTKETKETKDLYGIGEAKTDHFGRKCLLARRLVERGVRFIQIYSGGSHNDDNWDAHGDMMVNHTKHAGATDKPIAALLKDLKRRGLLDSTLVVWGGEFGRQPTAEYGQGTGRDHNSAGFTMWMAGGGIKGGTSVGATDELGNEAVENRFHVKNVHATILQQLGLDPNDLSYFYGGLDQKLVGVEGAEPIEQILA